MITIKPIGSPSDAAHYYMNKDNYYLSDQDGLEHASSWYGEGANRLNLLGKVSDEQFLSILKGHLPNGEIIGINSPYEHRAGTDVTFSMPKSISILALIGGDKRLLECHENAVRVTLSEIEKNLAEARITIDGHTSFEKTENLTIALFRHTTSRALDPLVHTHSLIMNATQREDGAWRALSSVSQKDKLNHFDNGFLEVLYRDQHYFGMIYMSELAKMVKQCGYDICVKDKYGNFEIASMPEEVIEFFSKRRQQILQRMKDWGLSSAAAAQIATYVTREDKKEIDCDVLQKHWDKEIKAFNVDLNEIILNSKKQKQNETFINPEIKSVSYSVKQAVTDAISHMSQYTVKLLHRDIVRQSFMFSSGVLDYEEIEKEIDDRIKNKSLIGKEQEYYTTRELLKVEKNVESMFKDTQSLSYQSILFRSGIDAEILKNKDKFQLINVYGLKAEKILIQNLVDSAENAMLSAKVLHVGKVQSQLLSKQVQRRNDTMVQWLKNKLKPELVSTVAKYIYQHLERENWFAQNNEKLVVIQDAQKLSYFDLITLNRVTEQSQTKFVLLNNVNSTSGFSVGNIVSTLQSAGIKEYDTRNYVNKAMVDIVSSKAIEDDILNEYFKAFPEKTSRNLVAINKKQQKQLNQLVRNELVSRNILSTNQRQYSVLTTQQLSNEQKKYAKFYSIGDKITINTFTKEQKSFFILENKDNTLTVSDRFNRINELTLDEVSSMQVTKSTEISLGVGDELLLESSIFMKNWKLEQGQILKVSKIQKNGISVKTQTGQHFLSLENLKNSVLNYNYVKRVNQNTEHTNQAIVMMKSFQVNKELLAEIAEFAENIKLFTDNVELAQRNCDKASLNWRAIDIAGRKPENAQIKRLNDNAHDAIRKDLEIVTKSLIEPNTDTTKVAVAYAMAKLGEREAAYEHTELIKEALFYAIGNVTHEQVNEHIEERVKAGDLIKAGTYWISPHAKKLEEDIISVNKLNQNSVEKIVKDINQISIPDYLTEGQKNAVTFALTSTDRFIAVQGLAGTGKTTMMNQFKTIAEKVRMNIHEGIKELAEKHGYKVQGLAPTHKAVQKLEEKNIPAMTNHSFLCNDYNFDHHTIFIIDESSMIENRIFHELQTKIQTLNARGIFSGDMWQEQAICSGKPFELSIKSNSIKTIYMNNIIRQSGNLDLLKAVESASKKDISKSFEQLDKIDSSYYIEREEGYISNQSVIEIPPEKQGDFDDYKFIRDINNIYTAIVEDYFSRVPEVRQQTKIIAHAHEDRKKIHEVFRAELKDRNLIEKNECEVTRFENKNLNQIELLHAKNFEVGDVLGFYKNYSIVKAGEYFTVTNVDIEKNKLTCKTNDGITLKINPAKIAAKSRMIAYGIDNCSISVGEKLRLTRTDKKRGWQANEEYSVTSISDHLVLLENEKHSLTINLNEKLDKHWDYAYTSTSYGIQGDDSSFIIALELSYRKNVTTHKSHYIDISRAKLQATIYTDDKNALLSRLNDPAKQFKSEKTSALEILKSKQLIDQNKSSNKTKDRDEKTKFIDAYHIIPQLHNRAKEVVIHLLGQPKSDDGDHLRYSHSEQFGGESSHKKQGSLFVAIKGEKQGLWYSHKTGESGNMLQLIQKKMNLDFKESLNYSVKLLGLSSEQLFKSDPIKKNTFTKTNKIDKSNPKHWTSRQKNSVKYARKIASESTPLKNTLAERYLKLHRGINFEDINGYIDDIRFHPSVYSKINKATLPALISIARNNKGEVQLVEAIYLDEQTANKAIVSKLNKQTWGVKYGASLKLNDTKKKDINVIVEGVVDGLSILASNKNVSVNITYGKGMFEEVASKSDSKINIIGLDNDGGLEEFVNSSLLDKLYTNRRLWYVMPNTREDFDKTDMNNVYLENGKDGISNILYSSKLLSSFINPDKQQSYSLKSIIDNQGNLDNIKLDKLITNEGSLERDILFRTLMALKRDTKRLNQIQQKLDNKYNNVHFTINSTDTIKIETIKNDIESLKQCLYQDFTQLYKSITRTNQVNTLRANEITHNSQKIIE